MSDRAPVETDNILIAVQCPVCVCVCVGDRKSRGHVPHRHLTHANVPIAFGQFFFNFVADRCHPNKKKSRKFTFHFRLLFFVLILNELNLNSFVKSPHLHIICITTTSRWSHHFHTEWVHLFFLKKKSVKKQKIPHCRNVLFCRENAWTPEDR